MTIKQWREDADKVSALRKLLERPIMTEALSVLEADGPMSSMAPHDISPTYGLIRAGRLEQHLATVRLLRVMATHEDKKNDIAETYEEEK